MEISSLMMEKRKRPARAKVNSPNSGDQGLTGQIRNIESDLVGKAVRSFLKN